MTSTDRAMPAGAQVALHKLHHFAAAFADKGNDVNVRAGVTGHHAHEGGFAHAGPGHDAHALALAQGEQAVHRTYAHVQNVRDAGALQGARRVGIDGGQLRLPVLAGLRRPCGRKRPLFFHLAGEIGLRGLPHGQGRGVYFRAYGRPGVQGRAKGVKSPAQQIRPYGKDRRKAGVADAAAGADTAHVPIGHE